MPSFAVQKFRKINLVQIFYFLFFAFHSVILAFRVQILTKTLARKKGHCPANDWPEMCKGLETYIQ